ncbi:MAG: CBS domain-containing protein [Nitrospira sp.]|nr:CBS domain-containing protein [Nitrospira sp.]
MCIATDIRGPKPQFGYELETNQKSTSGWDDQHSARVKDLMTWNASVVSPKTTLHEACYLFSRLEVEGLVVFDGRTYQGLLTYSCMAQMSKHLVGAVRQISVSEVMDQSIESVAPDELVMNAYRRMRLARQECLPVLDTSGKLAGLLTTASIEARFPSLAHMSTN